MSRPSLLSGPIFQVCWVVDDIAAAEEWFAGTCGVDRWMRIPDVHFGPESCVFRGEPADFVVHVALGYAGGQQLELIQPVSGRNLYVEQLERTGPGMHHVAWIPDDFGAAVTEATSRGVAIPQRGSMAGGLMDFAYLEGGPSGSYVEIMRLSDPMRQMFDELIPDGFTNPWT